MSRDKPAITILWAYQSVCILWFDSLLSLMTEQHHDDLIFRKYNFIRLCQKQWISLKTGCCFHYIALLFFIKVLLALVTDTVTCTRQRWFLLAFGAWRVFILGPGSNAHWCSRRKNTKRIKPRSDVPLKSDLCVNPIEIRSYLNTLNGNELHEIWFVQIRFELHVVWNTIQIDTDKVKMHH